MFCQGSKQNQKSEMVKKYFFPSISLICKDESSPEASAMLCYVMSQGWNPLLWCTFHLKL